MTAFINQNNSKVSFASPYPGKIIPIDLTQFEGKFICQKDFAAKGVSVGIEFSKTRNWVIWWEGFIMQIEGTGICTPEEH
jgi:uncharacterized protein (AIM24 family)